MEVEKKTPENTEKEPSGKISLFVIAWILSLSGVYLYMNNRLSNQSISHINKEYSLIVDSKYKFDSRIRNAPIISDALLSITDLRFDVLDTYFAEGTRIKSFLEKTAVDEGLKLDYGWLSTPPAVSIQINGNANGVHVTFLLMRCAYFRADDPNAHGFHDKEMYFQSYVLCDSKEMHFPAGTTSEEVVAWLSLETRALCTEAKIQNENVLSKVRERSEKEAKK